ncbi:hypothetical protein GCM10017083_38520 [Thalassobaculum fulvum]|jgi:hypothetical protein|uniref:AFP-like domain-containing protein n=1 Tax=Thalassobaculum fulvum TaxID=1633335 RepID=A0A918XUK7_9PROT|nr:SAF domain-containing protein [Thalassobaculum fulvum]GHD57270.1 hypothetical protein GCM10017083_38520 [Thalassobaculum fulvum]
MRRILLTADAPELTVETVDEATPASLAEVAARYHVVIPADHMAEPPLLADGVRAAFLCTDLDAFDRLRRLALPGDLLFKPSPVARLDLLRRSRRTLVAARAIPVGTVLTEADLAEVIGGTGIGAEHGPDLVGRRAMYAMAEGVAVDFGMISEDPVGVPPVAGADGGDS